jgi:hypothetical protein
VISVAIFTEGSAWGAPFPVGQPFTTDDVVASSNELTVNVTFILEFFHFVLIF